MQANREYDFAQLDVFTSRPLEGNPLAVFPDARGLNDAEMQALAREMNLSETTFVLPRSPEVERREGVRVRIFTVQEELPFAGHPTLGTAFLLKQRQTETAAGGEILLDLSVGKIPVTFSQAQDGSLFGEMRQRDPEFGTRHSPEEVARATGLPLDAIASDLPVETVSTGVGFAIVPLRSLEISRALKLDLGRAGEYLQRTNSSFFYFVTRETVDPAARLHARMLFYNGEDPATGSAAGCTAAWMVAHGVAAPEEQALIEQGLEAKHPSRIFVRAARAGDRVVNVRVGGNAVQVARGRVFL